MASSACEPPCLLVEADGDGVGTLTLNRPERRNALNEALVTGLRENLALLGNDPAIRVIVLSAAGEVFCSGADLKELHKDQGTRSRFATQLRALLETLWTLPKATIARVDGPAYGGGAGLIAVCDLALASERTTLAFTELRLGLVPAMVAPYIISAIGVRRARHYFLTGETISAGQALAMNLLTHVVTRAALDTAVREQAGRLLAAGPEATAATKHLLRQLQEPARSPDTAGVFQTACASAEAREGISAFLQKRKPSWLR